MEGEAPHQQVMGPPLDQLTSKHLVPKFKYDGGNPAEFLKDFSVVGKAFGVEAVYKWELDDETELNEDQEEKNTLALLVLRQYITERVLKIITVGRPKLASTIFRNLDTIFLANDARTKVQVSRELQSCEMGIGESLVDFIARINGLMEEAETMGETFSQENRMVTVATRLREPFRQQANDKMDRDSECTYNSLCQHLILRQRSEKQEPRRYDAYAANSIQPNQSWRGGRTGWTQLQSNNNGGGI